MAFQNFPQPTRPTSISNLTSFKYSSAISQHSEPNIILQDFESCTQQRQLSDQDEEEVFHELTQILFECLDNVDTEHKALLLQKIFLEIEKEGELEKFIIEKLMSTQVKAISELLERYPAASLQGQNSKDGDEQPEIVTSRGLNHDVIGSTEEFSRKLERFKVKTINIEGGVIKK